MNNLRLVPEIEKEIVDRKLDTLVMGLGPTAWLVPWIDRKILNNLRIYGAHDVFRIFPVDDLVLFDSPNMSKRLHLESEAFKHVVNARPKRIWAYRGTYDHWEPHIHFPLRSVVTVEDWFVWQRPKVKEGEKHPEHFLLEDETMHTVLISPTGMTTLAWRNGGRRIGLIGVDMGPEHGTHQWRKQINHAFVLMAQQAHAKDGVVCNLSPISVLKGFREWTPEQPTPTSQPGSGDSLPAEKTSSGTTSTVAEATTAGRPSDL